MIRVKVEITLEKWYKNKKKSMLSVKNIIFCFFKKKDNLEHTQGIFS